MTLGNDAVLDENLSTGEDPAAQDSIQAKLDLLARGAGLYEAALKEMGIKKSLHDSPLGTLSYKELRDLAYEDELESMETR